MLKVKKISNDEWMVEDLVIFGTEAQVLEIFSDEDLVFVEEETVPYSMFYSTTVVRETFRYYGPASGESEGESAECSCPIAALVDGYNYDTNCPTHGGRP